MDDDAQQLSRSAARHPISDPQHADPALPTSPYYPGQVSHDSDRTESIVGQKGRRQRPYLHYSGGLRHRGWASEPQQTNLNAITSNVRPMFNRQIDYMILTILLWMDGCPASAVRLLRIIVHACHDNGVMGKMSLLLLAPL